MELHHILAAADESEEGRAAIFAAARLLSRPGSRLSVLQVEPHIPEDGARSRLLEGLRTMVAGQLRALRNPPAAELVLAAGIPDVEIGHYAETEAVDLIVVGRKHRSSLRRLMAGDTADAVARRSRSPCLSVPAGMVRLSRVLVALDGTERGQAVLLAAMDFARETAGRLRGVTVERPDPEEPGLSDLLTARSARLSQMIEELRQHRSLGAGAWEPIPGPGDAVLAVHRGNVVEELLNEVEDFGAEVLVLGYHRGGPAGVIEAGSIARRILHEASCAVLTIPL
jgi:nucleotide-binding universal stress UspA family protein